MWIQGIILHSRLCRGQCLSLNPPCRVRGVPTFLGDGVNHAGEAKTCKFKILMMETPKE